LSNAFEEIKGYQMDNSLELTNKLPEFEDLGFEEDGKKLWYARDLMAYLGYSNYRQFSTRIISRAMTVPTTLGFPTFDIFTSCQHELDSGEIADDFKITRFACMLIAMNADPEKPEVASAQAYLAGLASTVQEIKIHAESVQRVELRDEMTQRVNSLERTISKSGLIESKDYAIFKDAGYRGMYDMSVADLKKYRGIPKDRTPLDFMGKKELAANLFRETQTELRIEHHGIIGKQNLNQAAKEVGREVRNVMIKNTGIPPENLPVQQDIKDVRRGLKSSKKKLDKLDGGDKE
jgi:DNA-damage-inducible protein D